MRKILATSLIAVMTFGGCYAPSSAASGGQNLQSSLEGIDFSGVNDPNYKVKLVSKDNFATAILTDVDGRRFELKNAASGSGVRMISDSGVEIHFKNGEGIVNFGREDIFLKY